MKIWTFVLTIILMILVVPMTISAEDYTIPELEINAHLQENGNVFVEESHTYRFEGEFSGIIRELIPKRGTDILNVEAFDSDQPLEIEQDENELRIHHAGEDETITIHLTYEIIDGVERYSDLGQFYWPFFDDSNESDYGDLTINVFPPAETLPAEVIAFGDDEAFETENIHDDGSVTFSFGEVPSGSKGDIRVAFDSELFPATSLKEDTPLRKIFLQDQQTLKDKAIAFDERRDNLASLSAIILPVFAIILGFIVLLTFFQRQRKMNHIKKDMVTGGVPSLIMSLPATILFTKYQHQQPPSEVLTAALLDLVRKGNVTLLPDEKFKIIDRTNVLSHEKVLIVWLFDEIGQENIFDFEMLKTYADKKSNFSKYKAHHSKWVKELRNELKEHCLYKKRTRLRWSIGIASLVLVPFLLLFPFHDLVLSFLLTLFLFVSTVLFSILYNPKTYKGAKISLEWSQLNSYFDKVDEVRKHTWTKDDQMKVFLYGLGTNNEVMTKKNKELILAFSNANMSTSNQTDNSFANLDVSSIILISALASSSFRKTDRTTGVVSADSSSSSGGFSAGGGGGVGVGGGGSGAF
ncbi:DUF2207 domain-containing protein [Salipaludibacillus sp. CF4.18]|uniref:DUF2207 domain-containing protein n=1 Tax=Salipaludibacillus sp. CF4.18 TaxID=3373081 RepID=UPI003EE5A724